MESNLFTYNKLQSPSFASLDEIQMVVIIFPALVAIVSVKF